MLGLNRSVLLFCFGDACGRGPGSIGTGLLFDVNDDKRLSKTGNLVFFWAIPCHTVLSEVEEKGLALRV